MYDKSQLMKGTLEGCILQILSETVTYGYEIVTTLTEFGFEDVKEGSIYPLLVRLEKEGNDFFRITSFAAWTETKVLFINV